MDRRAVSRDCGERGCCKVERVEIEEKSRNIMALPAKILERGDLALVGAGSLSCLAALYAQAKALNRLHQFFYCCLSPVDYAGAGCVRKIQEQLQKALDKKGTGGVILYASCLEILTGFDFEGIKAALWNPKQVPVEILRRGPMVTRYEDPKESLKKILDAIPQGRTQIGRSIDVLPVPFPDMAGIARCLQSGQTYNFLMTAGGCSGCIPKENNGEPYQLYKSRFHDLEAAGGCEEKIRTGIFLNKQKEGLKRTGCLLGSAVPGLLSFDGEKLAKELTDLGETFWYLPSDGFHTAAEGLAGAILKIGQKRIQRESCNVIQVNILGSHPLSAAKKEQLSDGAGVLKRKGFLPVFLDMENWGSWEKISCGAFNWVTAAEWIPLAKWMEDVYSVPWICELPVGEKAALWWMQKIERTLMREKQKEAPERSAKRTGPEALLLGEPVLTKGVGVCLEEEFQWKTPKRAAYAPLPSAKRWLLDCGMEEVTCFAKKEELAGLLEDVEVVFADEEFRPVIKDIRPQVRFLPLSSPLEITGRGDQKRPPQLFGKRGAAWLREQVRGCCP